MVWKGRKTGIFDTLG
nr:hypothetical protein [Candidatus Brachybacter algidus]